MKNIRNDINLKKSLLKRNFELNLWSDLRKKFKSQKFYILIIFISVVSKTISINYVNFPF